MGSTEVQSVRALNLEEMPHGVLHLEKSWFRFAAELESARASSRKDEIDLRARFSRRLLPFGSLSASVGRRSKPALMNERDFPLS